MLTRRCNPRPAIKSHTANSPTSHTSTSIAVKGPKYFILTTEPKPPSIPQQSTPPRSSLPSIAHALAARSSSRPIASSPIEQNRLVESDVVVAVRGTAPTQLLHRPRQHLLHTHTSFENITYRAAVADLNAYVGGRAPVVRLPVAGNLAPGYIY